MKRFSCCAAFLVSMLVVVALGISWVSARLGVSPNTEDILLHIRDLSPLDALPSRQAASDFRCSSRAPLVPRVEVGPMLERHRHSLELAAGYDLSAYVIVNSRTGAVYHWGYEGPSSRAQAVFGVPTGFAILNPGWEQDSWVLLYDCG
jgi:hypothetical protein